MNREIKFRGKRKDCWIYGSYYYRNDIDTHLICGNGTEIPVNAETVGQYTGLKDKKGKEIYEGDIYHMGDKNIKYVVVWNDTGLTGKQIGSSSYAGLSYWQNNIEIIGNIYENPELLKGDK